MDKGKPIPVILNKKVENTGPIEVNVQERKIDRRVFHQEQVSLDKIVSDSDSQFYITGKTTKIGLRNFLQLVSKHDMNEVENLDKEEIVVSSDMITRIATASVVDEDEEGMKYVDSFSIGIFIASFLLSIFALMTKTETDLKTFAWILLLVSTLFLVNYTYRGIQSKELHRIWRLCIKSLSKK
ncbi:MAG: hypothetical protein AB7J40_01105 [Candidatus Altimarinota bacterium]